MGKTIGYIRVSTTRQQEEGFSLEAQERKIRAYADLHDMSLTEVVEDSTSGKSVDGRPGFTKIVEEIKAGLVDNLIILKLDRMARNTKEAMELADLLQTKGCALHSVTEKLDTKSAGGRLFFSIMAAVATWEREVISERTVTALAVKKANGERLGRPVFGTKIIAGEAVVDHEVDELATKVRALKAEGMTVRDSATLTGLNKNRISKLTRAAA